MAWEAEVAEEEERMWEKEEDQVEKHECYIVVKVLTQPNVKISKDRCKDDFISALLMEEKKY